MKVARKGSPHRAITAAEAGEVALCCGWIDSVRRSAGDGLFAEVFAPQAEQLVVEGQRRPRGGDRAESGLSAGTRSWPLFRPVLEW